MYINVRLILFIPRKKADNYKEVTDAVSKTLVRVCLLLDQIFLTIFHKEKKNSFIFANSNTLSLKD